MFNLTTPPILSGTTEHQLMQLRSYLYQMSEQLNMASLSIENNSVVVESRQGKPSESAGEYNELRSLINKTAEYTEKQITVINNLTGEHTKSINKLNVDVGANNQSLLEVFDDITKLNGDIKANVTVTTQNTESITKLNEDLEANVTTTTQNTESITKLNEGLEANVTTTTQNTESISKLNEEVEANAELITNTSEYTSGQIDDLRGRVNSNTDEIASLSATVMSEYVAKSEYGTWQEDICNQIGINSDSITQALSYISALTADINNANASFSDYVVATEGYIKAGIVEWSEDGTTPLFGVAVGQNLTYREVTISGETYAEIDKTNFLATFTAKSLKFWQDNQVVAYVSNNKLYITNAEIVAHMSVKTMSMGDKFEVRASSSEGFVIEYIGE